MAAKAYKNNPISQGKSACLLNITDNDKTFTNVFVAKNGAIRTFYPDATPDFQGTYKCKV
ncbi:EndoU domain-containing protein [Dolichospermum sp. FACHB-1091]|uniref:EndoU domain-containing protein n=1 Tax=Dolichospermum sp. FACHB-1091 TaxID=2692798 RepID=UPI00321FF1EB